MKLIPNNVFFSNREVVFIQGFNCTVIMETGAFRTVKALLYVERLSFISSVLIGGFTVLIINLQTYFSVSL